MPATVSSMWQEQANFWGYEGFLPEFSQTCMKSFCKTFAYNFSLTNIINTSFWCDLPKEEVFMCFSVSVGCHILKSNNVGRQFFPDFQGICSDFQVFCPDFQEVCPDFWGFCPDFRQMKTFEDALASPPPTLLVSSYSKQVGSVLCLVIRVDYYI